MRYSTGCSYGISESKVLLSTSHRCYWWGRWIRFIIVVTMTILPVVVLNMLQLSSTEVAARMKFLPVIFAVSFIIKSTKPSLVKRHVPLVSSSLLIPPSVLFDATPSTIMIEECIDWIDRYCDRSFLHAVVASNYHFLYRGITSTTRRAGDNHNNIPSSVTTPHRPIPTLQYEVPDLLQIETYGYDGVRFFQRIEDVLQNEVVRPSNGHLGTTVPSDAAVWGDYAASLWPSAADTGSHSGYAWFRDGGIFYPRNTIDRQYSNDSIRRLIVVDGGANSTSYNASCNDESLVEALQLNSTGCEIMFTANTYLAIPSIYDHEVRAKLQESFVI